MRLRSGHRVLAEPPPSPTRFAAKGDQYTRQKRGRSIIDYNIEELNEMSIDEIAEVMPKWADYHMVRCAWVALRCAVRGAWLTARAPEEREGQRGSGRETCHGSHVPRDPHLIL